MYHLGNHAHKFNHIPLPDYATLTTGRKMNCTTLFLVTTFSAKENNI